MGRPRKYETDEERKAANREAARRWRLKRKKKPDPEESVEDVAELLAKRPTHLEAREIKKKRDAKP